MTLDGFDFKILSLLQDDASLTNAALAEGVRFDPASRRLTPVGSSCGLCGARTLEELERELPTGRAELELLERELDQATRPLYRERGVLTRN